MISGEKVVLKGITKSDSSKIYEWVNKEELRPLTGTLYPISEYEHEEWVERQSKNPNGKIFMVYEKESGQAIGTIGLKNFDHVNSNAELYISLGEIFGGGNGKDALVNYAFLHLNFHRIYLHVFESNRRAIRCYEKAGFEKEGILIDHHFQNGRYENVIIMGRVYSPQ